MYINKANLFISVSVSVLTLVMIKPGAASVMPICIIIMLIILY